jgi:hypothetical protein
MNTTVWLRSSAKCAYVCDYRASVVPFYYLNELEFSILQAMYVKLATLAQLPCCPLPKCVYKPYSTCMICSEYYEDCNYIIHLSMFLLIHLSCWEYADRLCSLYCNSGWCNVFVVLFVWHFLLCWKMKKLPRSYSMLWLILLLNLPLDSLWNTYASN